MNIDQLRDTLKIDEGVKYEIYNDHLGYPTFGIFIAGVNAGDWNKAAVEMMDSRWAKQVGARAERLRDRIQALA
jgi:GH24 family phage-related lysozyme (muramidase)